ncbi:salicylate hydroxylase [Crepidotus variabilis]|uniref:Salicylate hydroxylase n=1 Tax=Crepidotus variabilis TaxID=179855 RepID=A0A9P6JL36_9AGAR|nr:salicylate hydroxylase [Crepidotus variabilis]
MSSCTRFKVAICGGGIGGLVTAVALSKYPGIEVEIYETAHKLTELGAGIGLFSRPWEVIRRLGLEPELLQFTEVKPTDGPVTAFRYRKSDRPTGVEFYTLKTQGHLMTFHRPDFQKVLLSHLPASYQIHCSKRLRSYYQRNGHPITLLFEDGTEATCDVLLGADGLKSAVRRSLLGEKVHRAQKEERWTDAADLTALIEPSWSGTNAYRALVPGDMLRSKHPNHRVLTQPTQYLGKNGYIIAYPISKGKYVNVVAFKSQHELEGSKFDGSWVCPVDKSEYVRMFEGWEPEVLSLLECVEKPLRWAIHCVKPLPTTVSGHVALLGDAAHATVPHQGSGAGSAIEDAYMLATVLGHPTTTQANISRSLSIYDRIRRPFSHRVQERAKLNGLYFTFSCLEIKFDQVPEDKLLSKLKLLGQVFTKNWEWSWTTSIEPSVQEALKLLDEDPSETNL